MKTTLTIGLFLVGLCLGTAQADREFGDGTLPEFLQQFDVNEDGMLDEEERQAIKEMRKEMRQNWIEKWDSNGDGFLNREERRAAHEAIRERIQEERTEKFNELDTDASGALSLEEFAACPGLADKDPERVEMLFNHLDKNEPGEEGYGEVSLEEFLAPLHRHRRPGGHGGPGGGPGSPPPPPPPGDDPE